MINYWYIYLRAFSPLLCLIAGGVIVWFVSLWLERRHWRRIGRFKRWEDVEHLMREGEGVLLIKECERWVRWCSEITDDELERATQFYETAFETDCPRRLRALSKLRERFGDRRVLPVEIDYISNDIVR